MQDLLALILAEDRARHLFEEIERRGMVRSGILESKLNKDIYLLADTLLGIRKYWHKRIVRAGRNTLLPYRVNPPDLLIQDQDIVFVDFGPILEEWEADVGRTYVVGDDPIRSKLASDVESAWVECRDYCRENPHATGRQVYAHATMLAAKYGWEFGGEIAGHIIGHFPHEHLEKEDKRNYLHTENTTRLSDLDASGNTRRWIIEIHFVNRALEIGGFFEQLLTPVRVDP